MTNIQFAYKAINKYQQLGGNDSPDVTLKIFQMIENDDELLADYQSLIKSKKSPSGVNAVIGKTICHHFELKAASKVQVGAECSLISSYTRLVK